MTLQITIVLTSPDPGGGQRAAFVAQANAFGDGLKPWADQANAMAVEMNANATTAADKAAEAGTSATMASNAAEAALAAKLASASSWVSGAAYVKDDVRWGPDGTLYRCTTPVSGSATPPAGDAAHWSRALINPSDLAALVLRVAANESAVDTLRGVPPVTKTAAHTLTLDDRGKRIRTNSPVVIPSPAEVPFPDGTTILVRNVGPTAITINASAGVTLQLSGTTKTGTLTLTPGGSAALDKDSEDKWFGSGPGLVK